MDITTDVINGYPKNPLTSTNIIEPLPWELPTLAQDVNKSAHYYNAVLRLDAGVGLLLDELKAAGLEQNTLILFVGDNGLDTPSGKRHCTELGLRVPMIAHWAGHMKGGQVRGDLVSLIDVMPSVLQAAGVVPPTWLEGSPLQSLLRGESPSWWRKYLYGEMNFQTAHELNADRSVRDAGYKLLLRLNPEPDDPAVGLYDLRSDPWEKANLADDPAHLAIRQKLESKLLSWRQRTKDPLLDDRMLKRWIALRNEWEAYRETNGTGYIFQEGDLERLWGELWEVVLDKGSVSAGTTATFVEAPPAYRSTVVISGPPTGHDGDPGVARVQDVGELGFDLRFQEWDYRERIFGDTSHSREDIPYLLLLPGRHRMSDGSEWEVGTFEIGSARSWQGEQFAEPFSGPPHLFLTAQTANGGEAISVRARNVAADGFEAALFEEEALKDGHPVETVGYVALYSPGGAGLLGLGGEQVPYLLQTLKADERWSPVLSQRIKVEEEQSADAETDHVDETIQVLALGDQFFAQQVTSFGGDPTDLRRLEPTGGAPMEWGILRGIDRTWKTLPFAKTYTSPVVVVKPVSNRSADAGVIRLQDVTVDHARVRYQEWESKDTTMAEDAFYLVSEAGEHSLGTLLVEAGKVTTKSLALDGQWSSIVFNSPFTETPATFASVMSDVGSDAVTTRITNLDFAGLDIAMDERESKGDGHANELLGWIAIQPGSCATTDRRQIDVFFTSLSDVMSPVPYPRATGHRHPTVVGDVDSATEADPVFLRYASPTNSEIRLKLMEETSADVETTHVREDVGVFVGE